MYLLPLLLPRDPGKPRYEGTPGLDPNPGDGPKPRVSVSGSISPGPETRDEGPRLLDSGERNGAVPSRDSRDSRDIGGRGITHSSKNDLEPISRMEPKWARKRPAHGSRSDGGRE